MFVRWHILFGLIFSLIIFFLFPQIGIFNITLIFLSSVLIDVDHYLVYAWKKKDFNLSNAYRWYMEIVKKLRKITRKQRNKIYVELCFLHGVESLIIVFFLGIFLLDVFVYIAIGMFFHLMLDQLYQPFYMDRIDKLSIVFDYIKYKKLKHIEKVK